MLTIYNIYVYIRCAFIGLDNKVFSLSLALRVQKKNCRITFRQIFPPQLSPKWLFNHARAGGRTHAHLCDCKEQANYFFQFWDNYIGKNNVRRHSIISAVAKLPSSPDDMWKYISFQCFPIYERAVLCCKVRRLLPLVLLMRVLTFLAPELFF